MKQVPKPIKLIGEILLVGGLLCVLAIPFGKMNFEFAEWILRIDYDKPTRFETLKQFMVPMAHPVVLQEFLPNVITEQNPQFTPYGKQFLQTLHVPPEIIEELPKIHPQLIDFEWLTYANPYPPLVGEVYPKNYPDSITGFSFGYMDAKNEYHQITWYRGESSTLPSPFVSKRSLGAGGDYYVNYAMHLHRKVNGLGYDYPYIRRVDWSAYSGGSYDGLEAFSFSLAATLLELAVFTVIWYRKKHKIYFRIHQLFKPRFLKHTYPKLDRSNDNGQNERSDTRESDL